MLKYTEYLSKRRYEVILLLGNILYIYFFTWLSIKYHENFMTGAWDLGIFAQSLESFIRYGWLFYNNVELPYNPSGSFFGIHLSPILFLIVPLYYLYPSVKTLFLIQSIVLALPSIIVYKICIEEFKSKLLGLFIALSYLFYLPLHGANTFDFHVQSFIPLFYSLCFYFYRKHRFWLSYMFAILVLSCIEFSPFLIISLGIYIFLRKIRSKYRIYGIILVLTGIIWYFLAKSIIEYINPTQIRFEQYYVFLGLDISNISLQNFLERIFFLRKIEYLKIIFSSHLFIEMLAPMEVILLSGPWLAVILLTSIPMYFSPYFQYTSFIVFQLYIALIRGLKNLEKILSYVGRRKLLTYLFMLIFLTTIFSSIILGPIGVCGLDETDIFGRAHKFRLKPYMDFRIIALRKALTLIPENATILLPNNVFPHLYKNFNTYPSLIPGKTGYPLLLEKIIFKSIDKVFVGSRNNTMYFHGYIYNISLSLKNKLKEIRKTICINKYFERNTTIIYLNKTIHNITEINISILLKSSLVNISECIVYCKTFMIGLSQEKTPVVTIFPENRPKLTLLAPRRLRKNVSNLTIHINSTYLTLYIDNIRSLTSRIGEKLVGWIVDNVDYVLLDTVSVYGNFRIGICPIIVPKKYGLYAAGDGVMLFKKNYSGPVISLSNGKINIEFYDNAIPAGRSVLSMNMSRLEWRKWFWPIIPYAYKYNITRIGYNVRIEGMLPYSFVEPSPKVFYTNNIVARYSAIIRGIIKINNTGIYSIDVQTAYPSTTEIYIDGENIEDRVYLNTGCHELRIIWSNIVISYLKFQLKKC